MDQKRLVCLCNQVSSSEIRKILRSGALSLTDVQQHTAAGTSCGRCVREIGSLIENHKKVTPMDSQLKISFE